MLLDDLKDYLTSGGITTMIYRGFMPASPDEAIQIVETGGYGSVYAFGTVVEERPSVQIIRRSPVADRARAEMHVIKRMLDGFGDRTINGTHYKWMSVLQPPFSLGRDDTNVRELITMNVSIAKAVTTATST